MPATNKVTDARFVFRPAKPIGRGAAARGRNEYAGSVLIAKEHTMAILMPDAWNDAADGGKDVPLTETQAMLLQHADWDDDALDVGMHFAVGENRLAEFIQDIDHDLDKTPITGSGEAAKRELQKRLAGPLERLPSGMGRERHVV